MATTGFIDASDLDFTAYKEKLKTFLKSQDRFKDFNFDGSDLSVMLDLLAFNTYQNGFMLNMVGSEMFQDTAQLRESAVSHAKELNYVPRSRNSSRALVNVTVSPNDNPSMIVIPKFYSFVSSSTSANRSYIFSTAEEVMIRNNGGFYVANNVPIFEGRVVTEYFVANTSSRFLISSANVDITSLDVNVQNSRMDTTNTSFGRADSLHGLSGNSNVYFLQGAASDKYEIEFGNGVAGRKLVPGNVVRVTYRDCSGEEGDALTRFSPAGTLDGYSDINVTLSQGQASTGGSERETIESIKFNAPRHYATQGRSINNDDYISMVRQQFPTIESLAVFGGEQMPQKRYGKVVIAAKPYGGTFITNALKNSIQDYIGQRNSVGIDPIFVDPDIFYVEVASSVYYNINRTSKTTNDMSATVMTAIQKYATESLSDFSKDFHASRLETVIDNADVSIVSNETSTRVAKRKAPLLGQAQTIIIDYSVPLATNIKGVNTIESTYFTYTFADVDYSAYIADDSLGNLHIYTVGLDAKPYVLVAQIGKINYETGNLVTNPIIYTGYQGYISFYARTRSRDFNISRNQILLIDPLDVNINLYKAAV